MPAFFKSKEEEHDIDEKMVFEQKKYRFNGVEYSLNDFLNQKELRCIKALAMSVLAEHGWAMMRVSDDLRRDKELALVAIKNCAEAYEYLEPELQEDDEVMRATVESDRNYMDMMPVAFRRSFK